MGGLYASQFAVHTRDHVSTLRTFQINRNDRWITVSHRLVYGYKTWNTPWTLREGRDYSPKFRTNGILVINVIKGRAKFPNEKLGAKRIVKKTNVSSSKFYYTFLFEVSICRIRVLEAPATPRKYRFLWRSVPCRGNICLSNEILCQQEFVYTVIFKWAESRGRRFFSAAIFTDDRAKRISPGRVRGKAKHPVIGFRSLRYRRSNLRVSF